MYGLLAKRTPLLVPRPFCLAIGYFLRDHQMMQDDFPGPTGWEPLETELEVEEAVAVLAAQLARLLPHLAEERRLAVLAALAGGGGGGDKLASLVHL